MDWKGVKEMRKHVNLSEHIPNFKPNEKIVYIAKHLKGLNHSEWQLLKEVVDDIFEAQAAKLKINDLDELENRLAFEFSGIDKAQKLILQSALNKKKN